MRENYNYKLYVSVFALFQMAKKKRENEQKEKEKETSQTFYSLEGCSLSSSSSVMD